MGCFKLLNCRRNKKCTHAVNNSNNICVSTDTVNNSNNICVSDLPFLIPRSQNQSAEYPETTFKVLCYLQFLKNKICSNRTKSLLMVNYQPKNEDFAMERRFLIWFHPSFYNVIRLIVTPSK